jgi:hypothetical protein
VKLLVDSMMVKSDKVGEKTSGLRAPGVAISPEKFGVPLAEAGPICGEPCSETV